MLISIGYKHFIESDYIVEILKASNARAARIAYPAAEGGRIINATGGRKIRSIINLKSNHIVLSALRAETIKSKLRDTIISSEYRNHSFLSRKQKSNGANESDPPVCHNRRIETDRRRFSYTRHIPERRSAIERRRKNRR